MLAFLQFGSRPTPEDKETEDRTGDVSDSESDSDSLLDTVSLCSTAPALCINVQTSQAEEEQAAPTLHNEGFRALIQLAESKLETEQCRSDYERLQATYDQLQVSFCARAVQRGC